ncbi:MFS transporter [Terriglobus saanensis]|uniref:Drug resistance transporter, EmrB/QacA subfamily n=1 Tax=Terriglobus saanensis (strain ATCC BAA-1853 / DSM 23119 / SP1PR4) TaxID=401053 RepID=E8V5U7_TERSS|nr:MFS transporter [Terriglobus saanensis]ADV82706.1 drug resistance transporter, EmrB/QacA subfamily [Terriglobus saanensis SP1PR4]
MREATSPEPTENGVWILAATILGSSMAFIDGTVVNVALPAIQHTFHSTGSDVQWVVESYALLLASLLLAGGAMGDLYGRKKIFVLGVILFAAGSIWCGLAGTMSALILARGAQGIGAALLVPGSLALISASFPISTRGSAIGTWSGFTAMTAAVGPVLGGALVQYASWRWVFLINIPIAVVVVAITTLKVPESRHEEMSQALDWLGALLATVGLGSITYALIESSSIGSHPGIAAIVGVVSLVAFFVTEARSKSPMIRLSLFRSRNFSGANLLTFFLYGAFGGVLFFLPLNLMQVQHYAPTQAGGALLPLILLISFLSRWSGGLIARYGARLPLTIGPLIVAVGFLLFLRPGIGGSYATTLLPPVLILGIGMAVCVAPLTTAVMNAVPVSESGVASAVNNAVSRIAGLLAIAVFGLVLYAAFSHNLTHRLDALSISSSERKNVDDQRSRLAAIETHNPQAQRAIAESFVFGYRRVLWIAVALSIASSLSAALLLEAKEAS